MPHDVEGSPGPGCPYMGLASYTEDDADFFFGRDRERDLVIARLRAARLTLVYGQSGVGKSSLLNAGVVHRLKQLARFNLTDYGAPHFAVVSFASWQEDPLAELKRAVKEAVEGALGDESDVSVPDTGSLTEHLQACLKRLGGSLYVILDQFEEYFRYSTHQAARTQFVDEFTRAVNAPGLRVNFLIGIREDMLAELDRFKGRIPSLFNSMLRIEHLDRDGARLAIMSPLRRYGELRGETYEIEDELVDAVLGLAGLDEPPSGAADRHEFNGARGESRTVASLLQLVMERLWSEERQAGSRTLRLTTLQQRLGGARRIAETHVEERLAALSRDGREIAADVFDRLVTPSGVKIAHTLSDLSNWLHRAEADLEPVLRALCAQESRILRPTPEGRYEIYHDVLGRPIQTWLSNYRALKQERRLRRRVGVASMVLLTALLSAAFFIVRDWRDAVRETRNIEAVELAAQSLGEPDTTSAGIIRSALLAVESLRTAWTSDGERASQRILSLLPPSSVLGNHDGAGRAIQFGPGGQKVAIATTDNAVQVWTVNEEVEVPSFHHPGSIHDLSFSPDGLRLASACGDGKARVWDLNTGAELIRVAHNGAIRAASFSPDGRSLATASDDGTARIWDAFDGTELRVMRHTGSVPAVQAGSLGSSSLKVVLVSYSSSGSMLATASTDNIVRIWDISAESELARRKHNRSVLVLWFSLDGEELVTVSEDGAVRAWNIATDAEREMPSYGGSEIAASLSQDGKRVAIGSSHLVSAWQTATGVLLARMPHTAMARVVSLSPDGKWLATGSADGTARIWETSAGGEIFETLIAGDPRKAVLGPQGQWIVTTDGVGTVRVQSMSTEEDVAWVSDRATSPVSVAFDPEGEHVVALSGDGSVRTWSSGSREWLASPALLPESTLLAVGPGGRSFAVQRSDNSLEVRDVADASQVHAWDYDAWVVAGVFSADGIKFAVAGSDYKARIWDVETGEEIARLDHAEHLLALAFSPDGTRLATTDYGNTVGVWDLAPGGDRIEMVHDGWAKVLTFSPNGRYLATGSDDRTARLWDVASGRELARILHVDKVTAVAFDVTGTQLITVSGGSVWGWQVRPFNPADELCARLPRNFTKKEWEGFFPNDPYRCTCENLPPCE